MYGQIEYNEEGLPKCEICGRFFKRVIAHARQKHEINEREYKKTFGLDLQKGVTSGESSQLSRERLMENYDKVVTANLIQGGKESRFIKGDPGRTKDQVSAQTRARLKANLKKPAMIAAMQESGRKLAKTGLGNRARWNVKNI